MTEKALQTNDQNVNKLMHIISHEPPPQPNIFQDFRGHLSNNPQHHTLLGQDQKAKRNEHSIRMSSASAAINLYRNQENKSIMSSMKQEFNKSQIQQIEQCIRGLVIDMRHFIPIQLAFMKADKQ